MKANKKRAKRKVSTPRHVNGRDVRTHVGAPTKAEETAYAELRRSVLACMLWEDEFYESGASIADRIKQLCHQVVPRQVAELAAVAREKYHLRSVPLFLVRELARHEHAQGKVIEDALYQVIQRADELAEFVAMYWKDGKQPLSNAVKRGLRRAFTKFDAYQIAKYDREKEVRLRDVMFLVHAKPGDVKGEKGRKTKAIKRDAYKRGATFRHKTARGRLFTQLAEGDLAPPNTWEARIGAGEDYRTVMTELLESGKLGYMALLRNLRKLEEERVDRALIVRRLREGAPISKALPFRFIAAAVAAPRFEDVLDQCMLASLEAMEKLPGKTVILVDNSQSMYGSLVSRKSELTRAQGAQALAVIGRELCEEVVIYAFSGKEALVPPRRGIALTQAIERSTEHGGTYIGKSIAAIAHEDYDRLIVITDEQSHDQIGPPAGGAVGYVINVASYEHGIGKGSYIHVNGFSEQVFRFIQVIESGG